MAKQNPLSYVAPGVSAGAATVLPSKPFDPQAFFAELISQKKAEQQLELKKREQVQENNASWLEKISKFNKDYWDRDAEMIQGKASEILEKLVDITLQATDEGRQVNSVEQAKAIMLMNDLGNDIMASRKRQSEVSAIYKMAKETKDVEYDELGLKKLEEDLNNGTYSFDKLNSDYLIRNEKFEDLDISKEIASLLSTHMTTQGLRDITEVSEESIKAITPVLTATNSKINRHIRNLVKDGVIPDTKEAKDKKFNELLNLGVQSLNTANKARSQININLGGTTPSAPSKGGWVDQVGVVKNVPTNSTSGRPYEIPSATILPVASRFSEPILIDQGKFEVQDVAIIPVAIDDITWTDATGKNNTVKKGSTITKSQMDSMKNVPGDFLTIMEDGIVFAAYLTGMAGKNPSIRKFDDAVHGWIKEQAQKKKGTNFWTDDDRANVYEKVKTINANKAKYF